MKPHERGAAGVSTTHYHDYLPLANRLADRAGAILRHYFRRPLEVELKPDASPVSLADREVEEALRRELASEVPDHGVLGEEGENRASASEWMWVLDPIDGTRNFLAGVPLFTTLIALCHEGRPVLGVIDQPVLKERWVGVAGGETRRASIPVHSRRCEALKKAVISTTSPHYFTDAELQAFDRLRSCCQASHYGADGYAYAMLAGGGIDLVCEAGLKPYDYCALVPVIEGAGGRCTDWQGAPLICPPAVEVGGMPQQQVLASATEALHRQALAALAE